MNAFHKILLVLIAIVGAIAAAGIGCSSERGQRGETPGASGTVSEAVCSGSKGIPCFATAKAVVANTTQVFSNGGTLIDSYRSSLGFYGGANVGSHGDVQAGTVIHNGGVIHGFQLATSPAGFTPIAPPSCATSLGTFVLNSGQTATLSGGDYIATNFSLGGTLNIANISTAPVRIWVTGTMILGGKANTNGIPGKLQLLYTGANDVNENAAPGGAFYGLIYAPNANVTLNEPHFGSVIGKGVTLNGGSAVHFDIDAACVPPGSCLPEATLSVLVGRPNAGDVRAYVPNGDWTTDTPGDGGPGQSNGVKAVSLEGTALSANIPTNNPVNSCVANSATGQVICTSNGTDVYLVSGTTLTATLHTAGIGREQFSGGTCTTCGVAIDELHNTAVLSVGVDPGDSGSSFAGGYQTLNLSDGGFGTPIPTRGSGTSEGMIVDPMRNLVLSPRESLDDFSASNTNPGVNNYQVVDTAGRTVFDFVPTGTDGGALVPPFPVFGSFDSAGQDCLTGLALSTIEYAGNLFLTDLNHASFSSSTSTWSAPSNSQPLAGFETLAEGASGIAIAPNTHLGIVTGEFPPPDRFGAIQLPSALDGGAPSVVDWAVASLASPDGGVFGIGTDPHTVTAYTSPTTNKAFGVIANQVFSASIPPASTRTTLAIVDLQALLNAPRGDADAGAAHTVDPAFDLVANGVIRFVQLPP